MCLVKLILLPRRLILQKEFPNIPTKFIELKLKECKFLYQTYLALELAERTYDTRNPPYARLKAVRKTKSNAPSTMSPTGYGVAEIERELDAAKKKRERQEGELCLLDWMIPTFHSAEGVEETMINL